MTPERANPRIAHRVESDPTTPLESLLARFSERIGSLRNSVTITAYETERAGADD